MDLIIRRAGLRSHIELLDIGIDRGRIAAIERGLEAEAQRTIDAKGLLLAPTFVEPHTHMDKALTAERARSNPTGLITDVGPITAEVVRTYTVEDVYARAVNNDQGFPFLRVGWVRSSSSQII